jgi:hypothetical protein
MSEKASHVAGQAPAPSGELLEHAWRYFELHANQRISIFNYFLVLSGAVAAGLATTLQGSQRFSSLGVVLGLLLAVISFVFWKLDSRVSFLIKHAESALAEVEQSLPTHAVRLFLMEPSKANATSGASSWWSRSWTYGKAFRFVFAVMGLFGVAGAVLSALKFLGVVSW